MDDMDLCQQHNQELIDDALKAHGRGRPHHNSLTHCEECEEPIPEARRQAVPGCTRCVSCQEDHEQIHNHWRAL